MSFKQEFFYCRCCRHNTLHGRNGLNNWVHFFLTLLTAGIWLVIWLPLLVANGVSTSYKCITCGTKKGLLSGRSFRLS